MQRLFTIGLLGILGRTAKEVKESEDTKGKNLVKAGLILVAITQSLLMISDIMDHRKNRIESKMEELQ